jgi:hypothetical protein
MNTTATLMIAENSNMTSSENQQGIEIYKKTEKDPKEPTYDHTEASNNFEAGD